MGAIEFLFNGPAKADWTVALAHGAGAGMGTPFMAWFAEGLAARGVRVARFEFPYMAAWRAGRKRPPDRQPVLEETWRQAVAELGRRRLVIGGKSMGGRIASLVADAERVAGLVCLGYPFHPTGQPERLRTAHLQTIETPTLIVQGTRDPFGNKQEVAGYELSSAVEILWLTDGDHDLVPRKASGTTREANWREALAGIERFLVRVGTHCS